MYVPAREYQKTYGVHITTLRRWADSGKIDSIRTPGNTRLFKAPEESPQDTPARARIAYIRVSSPKQKDDLERQRSFMATRLPDHEVVSDIGSGINWSRKGFLSVLDRALKGGIEEVVVASRDRLCRFSFELVQWMLQRSGTRLLVLESEDQSPEQELSDDLMSIVQVFCCRRNGKRRYKSDKNEKGEAEPDHCPEAPAEQVC
jgi:predicted site-specific integrase-resolvase